MADENKKFEKVYFKNRKKEIPLYDPQTGEPNYEYEKLTGKPNPLIQMEKVKEMTGTDAMVRDMRKNMTHIPHNLEYKRQNRFLVHFPKEFNINPLQIESVTPPITIHKRIPLLGLSFINRTEISNVNVVIREIEEPSVISNLLNKMKDDFDFTIEMVNAKNIVLEKWAMKKCFIKEISTSDLSYKSDGILNTTLTISVSYFEII